MPAPPLDARSFTAQVVSVRPSGEDGCVLRVRTDPALPALRAARFFMLRREDGVSPHIPRPFSIYRQFRDELEFLIKVTGRGTQALADCREGMSLRLIGPLGNGWPRLDGELPWVFLAGGIGSVPFYMGIEQALAGMDGAAPARVSDIHYLYGAAREGLLYELDDFRALGVATYTATDDGSSGFSGNVIELLRELWDRREVPERVRLAACGPDAMLHAVERLAEERGLEAWLSLETVMGCGVGICNGCPVPTRPDGPLGTWPNAKCCVEGPVFSTAAITLEAPQP